MTGTDHEQPREFPAAVAMMANQARGAAYHGARTRLLTAAEPVLKALTGDHAIGGMSFLMADVILAVAADGQEPNLLALVHELIDYRFKKTMENRR